MPFRLLFKRFLPPAGLLTGLTLVGTLGYVFISHYPWIDALYMTIITIGTVGFGEIHPLDTAGRLFTIFLIVASLGLVTYYITLITRIFVDGEWLRQYKFLKQQQRIKKMEQHVIICGFGRNGREAAQILMQNQLTCVVIDEKNEHFTDADRGQYNILIGDGTQDEVLLLAGIAQARAIITTLPNDADNLFVVLSAKQLNPGIIVISRASLDSSVSKLKIAGATNVIMPDKLGGAYMATLVSNPDVQEFLGLMALKHTDAFQVTELMVTEAHNLGELNLWQRCGCTVLGVKQTDGKYRKNPAPDFLLMKDERLIVMGSKVQIEAAEALLNTR
jgi:voltage-gated potassium channel